MSTTKGDVPGLLLPTVSGNQAMPPGQAAIDAKNATIQQQIELNKLGGRKRRGGGYITVPQVPGDTSGANAIAVQSTQNSVQAAANAKYDKLGGGKRRHTSKRRIKAKGKKRRTIKGKKRRTIRSKK